MKKCFLLCMFVFVGCAPGVFTTQYIKPEKATVITKTDFNEGNSDAATTIKELNVGDTVTIFGQKNTWWYASHKADTGFVYKGDVLRLNNHLAIIPIDDKGDSIKPYKDRYMVGINYGGATDGSLALDIGAIYQSMYATMEIGLIGLSRIVPPSSMNDYPSPHSDITYVGWRSNGEYLLALNVGYRNSFIGVGGLLGVSMHNEVLVSVSNVTGWYYNEGDRSTYYFLYGIDARFFIDPVVITTGYDVRRGFKIGAAYSW